MWYKIVEHKEGRYIDVENKSYILVQCHRAMDPEGRKNKELGLTEFDSLEDCLKTWNLRRKSDEKREI